MNRDRARGALLGQATGDALGTTVEFLAEAEIARRFPSGPGELVGGGPFGVLPGQVTDDTELALTLARSLVACGGYDPADALARYRAWADSDPFDIGQTCAAAFQRGVPNPASQANGALMRASPLGIWGAGRSASVLAAAATADARLSHPHPVCVAANVVFTRAIAFAVETGGDPAAVFAEAQKTAVEVGVFPLGERPADYQTHQGWVVIALHNAFWQLRHAASFEAGVVDTVRRGGDTDTNAAIAGALLGAVYGESAIPTRWVDRVLGCESPRPALYGCGDLRALVDGLAR